MEEEFADGVRDFLEEDGEWEGDGGGEWGEEGATGLRSDLAFVVHGMATATLRGMQGWLHPVVVACGPWAEVEMAVKAGGVDVGGVRPESLLATVQREVQRLPQGCIVGVVVIRRPNEELARRARVSTGALIGRAFLAVESSNAELLRRGARGAEMSPVVWERVPHLIVLVGESGADVSRTATISTWNTADRPQGSDVLAYELISDSTTPAFVYRHGMSAPPASAASAAASAASAASVASATSARSESSSGSPGSERSEGSEGSAALAHVEDDSGDLSFRTRLAVLLADCVAHGAAAHDRRRRAAAAIAVGVHSVWREVKKQRDKVCADAVDLLDRGNVRHVADMLLDLAPGWSNLISRAAGKLAIDIPTGRLDTATSASMNISNFASCISADGGAFCIDVPLQKQQRIAHVVQAFGANEDFVDLSLHSGARQGAFSVRAVCTGHLVYFSIPSHLSPALWSRTPGYSEAALVIDIENGKKGG
jgi:hypothetical protein